ncbi:MAG: hypothetical protein D6823_00680 [Chloroflexi bacterium]|nr:MAG: hypothetical protein D6823_00680 [Chloroflexota bacterium]
MKRTRGRDHQLPVRYRESSGCFGQLVRLSVGLLVIAGLALLLTRPQLSAAIGHLIADLLAPSRETAIAPVPALIAALPNGTITVSEAAINGYLNEIEAALPVESVSVRLVSDRVIASVRAYGVTSIVSSGITVQDGRLVMIDPRLEGPLAAMLSVRELTEVLNERLNAEFVRQGRQIVAVHVDNGTLTIVTR